MLACFLQCDFINTSVIVPSPIADCVSLTGKHVNHFTLHFRNSYIVFNTDWPMYTVPHYSKALLKVTKWKRVYTENPSLFRNPTLATFSKVRWWVLFQQSKVLVSSHFSLEWSPCWGILLAFFIPFCASYWLQKDNQMLFAWWAKEYAASHAYPQYTSSQSLPWPDCVHTACLLGLWQHENLQNGNIQTAHRCQSIMTAAVWHVSWH